MIPHFYGQIKHYLTEVTDFSGIKLVCAFLISAAYKIFTNDDGFILFFLLVLIVIDCIFGVLASYKQGKSITSNRLSHTLGKIFVYFTLIIAFKIGDILLGSPFGIELASFCTIWISFTELYSITENADCLGFPMPQKLTRIIRGKIDELNKE